MARYSPFARALQEWLWHGRGYDKPSWSRRRLAEALDVSYSTIDAWFTRGATPEPEAFWSLARVTGWEPEKLAQLAGYSELPPRTLGQWDFLRDYIETHGTGPAKLQALRWIDEAQREYYRKPKRPGRRKQRQAMAAPTPAPVTPEPAPAETPADEVTAKRSQRGLVGAGK